MGSLNNKHGAFGNFADRESIFCHFFSLEISNLNLELATAPSSLSSRPDFLAADSGNVAAGLAAGSAGGAAGFARG